MIQSFRNRDTERFFNRQFVPAFQGFAASALVRLMMLNRAATLDNLSAVKGNRLESLSGNRTGQYSIRINRQWRVCFRWYDGDAYDVESWIIIRGAKEAL